MPEGSGGVLYFTKTDPLTTTVGPTGDFETLEEALAFYALHRGMDPLNPAPGFGILNLEAALLFRTSGGGVGSSKVGDNYLITILIQDNYVWNTPVMLYGGIDLSHIVVRMADETKYTPVPSTISSGALFTCTEGSRSPLFMNKVNMGAVSSQVSAFKAVGNLSTLEFNVADGTEAGFKYGCHVINCSGYGIELHNGAYSYGGFFFTGGTYLKSYNSHALSLFGKSPRCSCAIDASASKVVFKLFLELGGSGPGGANNQKKKGGVGNFIADPGVDSLGNPLAKSAVNLTSGSEVVFTANVSLDAGYSSADLTADPNLRYLFKGFQKGFTLSGGSSLFLDGSSYAVRIGTSSLLSLRVDATSGTVVDLSQSSRFVFVDIYEYISGVGGTSLCFRQVEGSSGFAVVVDESSLFVVSPRTRYARDSNNITDLNKNGHIKAIQIPASDAVSGTALFEIATSSAGIVRSSKMSRVCFENLTSSFASAVTNKNVSVQDGGIVTFATTLGASEITPSQVKNTWTINGIISDA